MISYPYGMGGMMPNSYPYMNSMNSFQQQPLQRFEIIKVNGRNGAEAFQMAPNSNTLLLDETAPIVWLAQTDGAGYKTVTAYTVTPYNPTPAVDMNDIETRLSKVEAMLNGKSDAEPAKQSRNSKQSDK